MATLSIICLDEGMILLYSTECRCIEMGKKQYSAIEIKKWNAKNNKDHAKPNPPSIKIIGVFFFFFFLVTQYILFA